MHLERGRRESTSDRSAAGTLPHLTGYHVLGLGWTEASIILVQFALFGLWVWGIVSAASFPEAAYRAGRMSKVWVVVGVVVVPFGFILYASLARPRLRDYRDAPRSTASHR
jgi:hypothetical protein